MLYSSVDDFVLREVVREFEAATDIRVRLLGDTEATKTTGLVQRLLDERTDPRADVWWSSEPFGTARLAAAGVFEPAAFEPPPVRQPALTGRLDGPAGIWRGFALRARVIGAREGRFEEGAAPETLADLLDPAFRGRVGMAQPAFGTTRGHMAALHEAWGPERFEAWLVALRENGLRLYSGNSSVVRAIADGEIDAGLTDTDDVWAARRNGWPVEAVFEPVRPDAPLPSFGPMLIPNTVALVRSGPNPGHAASLMEYLLAGPAEGILARSDSHNIPVRSDTPDSLRPYLIPGSWMPDISAVAAADSRAIEVCEKVLRGG